MISKSPRRGTPPLPVGTRVQRIAGGQLGTVQKYDCSVGQFPVRWDDLWDGCGARWEICIPADVRAFTPTSGRHAPATRPDRRVAS